MVERRDKVDTDGSGLGHSWADDNVARGDPDVDFIKRRLNYPFGDNPRGRDIDFEDTSGREAYGSTKNQVFRAYRGKAPLEGQEFGMPSRVGSLDTISDLRPEPPDRSTDDAANALLQAGQAATLAATNFRALMPTPTITLPAPGATFSPGAEITIIAPTTALRNLHSAVLEIDGQAVDRRVIDRRDQDSTPAFDFRFFYTIPAAQVLGQLTITIRAFNMESSMRGIILDDALGTTNRRGAVGTLDGRPGSATSAASYQKLLNETGFLRSPEGVVSITVNIV